MNSAAIELLVLAVVQGVTEFLPVSSSGHLVILGAFINSAEAEQLQLSDVAIALHVGTLLSIVVFYFRPLLRLLGEDRRTIGLLIVGTIPAVVVGLPIKLFAAEQVLENPLLAGAMLIVTGGILIAASRYGAGKRSYTELRYREAAAIGLSQAFAILPGVSRSGATIAMGMKLGLDPRSTATFSFLLAVPAIAGAGVVEAVLLAARSHPETSSAPLLWLAAAMAVSFVVGLAALWWLATWLERGKLQLFAWWCIPLGIAVVCWQVYTTVPH